MQHSFDVKLAKDYGILEAILIQNIYFWIEKNKANNKHFYDGRYWTYNSKKAFSELFPYASERQIKYSLEKLIKAEILVTGSYNKQWSDRTLWYSFTNKGLSIIQKCQMHSTNLSNENRQNCPMTTDNNAQPIPYINTDKNTDNKQEKENNKLFSKESSKKIVKSSIDEELFARFWDVYPKKKSKGSVEKWFQRNKPSSDMVDIMIDKINQLKRTEQWGKNGGQFIPYPSTWLNNKGWEDEISQEDIVETDEEETARLMKEVERRKAKGEW